MPPSGFIFLEISFSRKSSKDFRFRENVRPSAVNFREHNLKGLSHEIDFKNVDENGQILALLRAAAGF